MPVNTKVSEDGLSLSVDYLLADGTTHQERYVYSSREAADAVLQADIERAYARAAEMDDEGIPEPSHQRAKKLAQIGRLAIGHISVRYEPGHERRPFFKPLVSLQSGYVYVGYARGLRENILAFALTPRKR